MKGYKTKLGLSLAAVFMFSTSAMANIGFTNLTAKDFENVISDFSSNFVHTTVTGAGTQGAIFGFQVGLLGGLSNSPEIRKLSRQVDPSSDVGSLPHGGLMGVVSVPFGITVEAMMVPSLKADGAKFSNTGMAVKWTLTEAIPLPVDVAIRGHYTKTDLTYSQPINSVSTDVDFNNTMMGFQALVGMNLMLLKPYIGLGTVSADGELTAKGTQSIFDNSFTSSTKASKKVSSSQMLAGVELNLMLIKLGFEYSSQFGTDRYTAKLAVGF